MAHCFDLIYTEDTSHFSSRPSGWLDRFIVRCRRPDRAHALDMGCGHGRNAMHLARWGYDVTAVDSSRRATVFLRNRARSGMLPIHVRCADMLSVDIPPESFDLIVVITALGSLHRSRLPTLARNMSSGLRCGGLLAVEEFSPRDPGALGLAGASEFAPMITNYFSRKDMMCLFDGLQAISCTQLRVADSTHGHPHEHDLVRYVGIRPPATRMA